MPELGKLICELLPYIPIPFDDLICGIGGPRVGKNMGEPPVDPSLESGKIIGVPVWPPLPPPVAGVGADADESGTDGGKSMLTLNGERRRIAQQLEPTAGQLPHEFVDPTDFLASKILHPREMAWLTRVRQLYIYVNHLVHPYNNVSSSQV